MKPSSKILVLCHCLLTGCDAQVSEQARQQWLKEDSKIRKASVDRDKAVADFRSDLKMPWSELVFALRYDCSCTGTHYTGFCIARDNDSITVAPWIETAGIQRKGDSRPLTKAELEKLISEAALFYLAASLSVSPLEKVGPPPKDTSKFAAWRAEYLSVGGSPEGSDHLWMESRVISKNGVKTHHNMWEREVPDDFSKWIGAFGILPIR